MQVEQRWPDWGVNLAAIGLVFACGLAMWFASGVAIAFGFAALATLVIVAVPIAGFAAIATALPLVHNPVELGGSAFTFLELAIVSTSAGVLIAIVREGYAAEPSRWFKNEPVLWTWIGAACLFGAGLQTILMPIETAHLREAVRQFRWVIVDAVAMFVIARYVLRRYGIMPVIGILVLPAVVVSISATLMTIQGGSSFSADGVSRAAGPYLHPNNLALYLERIFVLCAGLSVAGLRRYRRLAGVAAGFLGAGLALTLSRGAIVGVAIGLAVIAWIARSRVIAFLSLAGMSTSVALFAIFAGDRLAGAESSGVGESRLALWRASIAMLRDYPVSGIGLDQFLYQHAPRYIDPVFWSERYISHPHNMLLDAWLSLGLAGLMLLIAAVILLARQARGLSTSGAVDSFWATAAIGALAAGAVHGLVDNSYFLPDLAALTWLLLAVATHTVCRSGELPSTADRLRMSGKESL
ncbi:hypothetical protein BH23CHL5_BH23CHL5_01620 [soil metagenome]